MPQSLKQTTISHVVHSLKNRIGYVAQRLSNRMDPTKGPSITTVVLSSSSMCGDIVTESASENSVHTIPQRSSNHETAAESQPLVVFDNQQTTTNSHDYPSTSGDEAQKITSEQSLCAICIDLNRLCEVAQSPPHELKSAAAQYASSSRGGCKGCTAVTKFLFERFPIPGVAIKPRREGGTIHARMRFLLTLFHMNEIRLADRHAGTTVHVLCYPNCPSPWPELGVAPPISGNTGSDQAVAWARRELEVCLSQHNACAHTKCNRLPTRVLRIDGPKDVKLHVTATEVSPYLCLSHCWGKVPIVTTTSLNLKEFQQNLPWEKLPKTFQDAISFTIRLGFRYLWIDSLCIIQDSAEDWRHEGSKMASIYQNATLTLAATSSCDSTGGCFVKTSPRYQSRKWNFTDAENNAYEIHTRSPLYHSEFSQWRLPLSTRAWAFQERVLSPRVLHFTENELIWECLQQINCECSDVWIYMELAGDINKTAFRPNEWADEPLEKIDRHWQKIVSLYTTKDVTFDKDIFPALQGLAKMVPDKMGPYLAGIWRNTVDSNLSWYVPGPLSGSRLEEWRAPSWSWASSAEPVEWPNITWLRFLEAPFTAVTYIAVLDVKVSTIGDDATGQITSGELLIRGRGLFGTLQPPDSEKTFHLASLELHSVDGPTIIDVTVDAIQYRESLPKSEWRPKIYWDYNIAGVGTDQVLFGTKLLALRIEKFTGKTNLVELTTWLLFKHCSQDLDAFERIGLLEVRKHVDIDSKLQIAPSILDQAVESSAEMDVKIV